MKTKEEVLKNSKIEGNVLRLPDVQLDRKLYTEVNKILNLIGGKWTSGKTKGFVFSSDPTPLIESILGEDSTNVKKDYQFFGTPPEFARYLVAKAHPENHHSILEPSAGQGAIVKAINDVLPTVTVDAYELMETNRLILNQKINNGELNCDIIGNDFLSEDDGSKYDRIIANPPFSKNQDITHVLQMYKRLKPGGIMVSVTSTHWEMSDNKKEREFKEWLDTITYYDITRGDAGTFKESGTNIETLVIYIRK